MATNLNSNTYAVLVRKDDGTQGEYHALEDKRWHSVEKAVQIIKINPSWTIVDITKDGQSDMEAHQALINRHDITTDYARNHQMGRTQDKVPGTNAPEKTVKLTFDEQELYTQPLSDTLKLVKAIGQSVQRGTLPVDSSNLLAT